MRWLSVLFLSIILTSCGAQWHLKKALKKDPSILQKDTLTVVDTIVLKPVEVKDTVVLNSVDTITIIKEKLKVNIFRSFDTIRVDAICDADTIVSVVEVPYEKIVYVEKKNWIDKLIVLFRYVFIGAALLLVINLVRTKR
jgi:hypothetical protein